MKISNKYLHLIIMMAVATVMVCGLSITAFASDLDPNMTYVNRSDLRHSYDVSSIPSGYTLTLKATTADSYWSATTFDTAAAAESVVWTSSNSNLAEGVDANHDGIVDVTAVSAPNGGYYSQATFNIHNTNGTGSCSIEARRGNGYINFTVVLDNSYYSDLADNIKVEIVDENGDTYFYAYKELQTVTLPTSGDLYNATERAQTFSTPMYALDNMVSTTAVFDEDLGFADYIRSYRLSSWGVFVDKITTDVYDEYFDIIEDYREASGYVGWNYRVVRNGSVVNDSRVIGAADFKLQDGDKVYWIFGTSQDADDYFN